MNASGQEPTTVYGHVGVVLDSQSEYEELVGMARARGGHAGEKVIVVGSAEPWGRGAALLAPFSLGAGLVGGLRAEVSTAQREGFRGIRVVADMRELGLDSLAARELLEFELDLDRVVSEAGATMVCAYRNDGFTPAAVGAAMCAHPRAFGANREDRGFRMGSTGRGEWRVSGEIDRSNADAFEVAMTTAAGMSARMRLTFDDLRFIDVAGMRVLARVTAAFPALGLTLVDPPPSFLRCWELFGFASAGRVTTARRAG
ncbi:MEDS domain-containing protein [Amycolatopsis magusensis]|uniref:MEDS domain-containing protein n=1 Tax=Amycolatopsis magusensis TaxID=882444 RepID=UPI00379C0CB0